MSVFWFALEGQWDQIDRFHYTDSKLPKLLKFLQCTNKLTSSTLKKYLEYIQHSAFFLQGTNLGCFLIQNHTCQRCRESQKRHKLPGQETPTLQACVSVRLAPSQSPPLHIRVLVRDGGIMTLDWQVALHALQDPQVVRVPKVQS